MNKFLLTILALCMSNFLVAEELVKSAEQNQLKSLQNEENTEDTLNKSKDKKIIQTKKEEISQGCEVQY